MTSTVSNGEAAGIRSRMALAAAALTTALFAIAGIAIWWPSLDSVRFVPTIVAPLALLAALVAFWVIASDLPVPVERSAIVIAIAVWAPLIFDDDAWSITVIVMYVLAWSADGVPGAVLAIAVTAIWSVGWLVEGADVWMLAIPGSVLMGSFFASWAADRIAEDNETKNQLIASLESSRRQLAEAEHSRGALAERARLASEVHDTLAQGFTSIVLLSRVARRAVPDSEQLEQIEVTALSNLDAARRLVANAHPAELDGAPLDDALRRQLDSVIGEDRSTMTIHGRSRPHGGAVEVAAFRAVQEALLNAHRHGAPDHVRLVVHHLDDEIVVDVIDDGCGFVIGERRARTGLPGGQGLEAMTARVESLGGTVRIESAPGSGTTVTVRLPTEATT